MKVKIIALGVLCGCAAAAGGAGALAQGGGLQLPPPPPSTGPIGPPLNVAPPPLGVAGRMKRAAASADSKAVGVASRVARNYGGALARVTSVVVGSEADALAFARVKAAPANGAPSVVAVTFRGSFVVPSYEAIPVGHARPRGTRLIVVVDKRTNEMVDVILQPT